MRKRHYVAHILEHIPGFAVWSKGTRIRPNGPGPQGCKPQAEMLDGLTELMSRNPYDD